MTHTVIFYVMCAGLSESTVATHRIQSDALANYTSSPGSKVAALRNGKGAPRVDGFRIVDERGQAVFDYLDRPFRLMS